MSTDIIIERSEGVQTLRLARPAKKNALTQDMYTALCEALVAGEQDDAVGAHVVLGSPGVFSAGNDIGDFLAHGGVQAAEESAGERFIRLLPRLDKPLLAAVDGPAIGIGTTLLLHCDLVYASPAASFATPFLDLGLVPEAGSSRLMPQRMGYGVAFEMLVLGEILTAERAHAAGLVTAIFPHADVEARTLAAARRVARKPAEAVRSTKRLMGVERDAIAAHIEAELVAFRARLASPEAQAAFRAFLERRQSAGRAGDRG